MDIRYDDTKFDKALSTQYTIEIKKLINNSDGLDDFSSYRRQLEGKLAKFLGVKHAFLVDSGSSALQLAFLASGLKKGDSVIVPAISHPATYASLISLGLKPIYVDISEKNLCLAPEKIEPYLEKNTKAIVVVHLYGVMANMLEILKIAQKYNLKIIEDASQALGSEINGKKSGCFGDFGAFSFRYFKTLSSLGGQGGLIVCQKAQHAKNLKKVISGPHKYLLKIMDIPFLDSVILKVKLKHVHLLIKSKIQSANNYKTLLKKQNQINLFRHSYKTISVRQIYPIFATLRDKLAKFLESKKIYLETPYKIFGGLDPDISLNKLKKKYPNSLKYRQSILLLPFYSFIKKEQIKYIADSIHDFYE